VRPRGSSLSFRRPAVAPSDPIRNDVGHRACEDLESRGAHHHGRKCTGRGNARQTGRTHLNVVEPYRIGLRQGRATGLKVDPGPWSGSPGTLQGGVLLSIIFAHRVLCCVQYFTAVVCKVELAKSQSVSLAGTWHELQGFCRDRSASTCSSPCNSSLQGYWHSLWPTRRGPHCDLPSSVLGRSCAGSCAGWSSRRLTRPPCATAATWSIFAASSARSAASSCAPRACCTRRTCSPRTGASALAASGHDRGVLPRVGDAAAL